MKSIRRRLTLTFLAAIGLLGIGAGAAIYLSYRAGLMAGFENELQTLCRQVRTVGSMGGGGGGGPRRGGPWRRFDPVAMEELGDGVYWQVRLDDEDAAVRSDNLPDELPWPADGEAQVVVLADGTRVMAAGHRFGMGRGSFMQVTVARPLDEVERKLQRLLGILLVSGAGLMVLTGFGVRLVVGAGLAPLRRIAGEVERIDVSSLDERFDQQGLPEELRPITARLNDLMERMDHSFARERRFSADLAHEMRTPLAETKTIAETALKWPEEGGPEAWGEVVASSERMERVVHAMLQLARIERERPDGEAGSFPLRPLVDELWSDHAATAAARRVTFECQITKDAVLQGDRSWWSHLLGNLLGNAAEYADEGGCVTVSAGGGETLVAVRNPASDLDEVQVGKLFDRFWRADGARGESDHCGLGLSLARACAEAMGCRLEAELIGDAELEIRVVRE
ncbi:histidine kinase dimerization/phospho-acceptor domain-containing protein [Haloferula sp. A504]|uniref:histidine kinase dimerization/phospho-acceptor domain-containing protein n=1 Tax=Haloferula sp. A504 TaxID=3373601 RepID=UPI0031C9E01A|nr:ATP-binding protein [Verrucomicrobiaceae bacterium E54]